MSDARGQRLSSSPKSMFQRLEPCLRATPGTESSRIGSLFADLGWTPDLIDRRPPRVPGAQRQPRTSRLAGARREELSGKVGAGLGSVCRLADQGWGSEPGQRTEVLFFLGQGDSHEQARSLVERYRTMSCDTVLREVQEHWDRDSGCGPGSTPNPSMDLLLNRWLLYQTLSCRSGAARPSTSPEGRTDSATSLQDVMALTVTKPDIAREHLLRASAQAVPRGRCRRRLVASHRPRSANPDLRRPPVAAVRSGTL